MISRSIQAALASLLSKEQARRLEGHVERLPDPQGAVNLLRRLGGRAALPRPSGRLHDFLTLAGFSPHLGSLMVRNPGFLDALPSGRPGQALRTREDMEEDLARFQFVHGGAPSSKLLLQFKQRECLRIALADFLRTADLAALTRSLSLLADVLIDRAVRFAHASLEARFGRPTSRDDRGQLEEAAFVVLALGKLGGEELNYSSDIDLVYLFSRDGETSGKGAAGSEVISNRAYYTRLATEITRLIGGQGARDRVFRVDLDLRPGGRDGDLVISIGAAFAYYSNWAEMWERQALIKARPVAGDLTLGHRFCRMVEPLVYEERPDPYLTVEIGAMKDRIDAQLSALGQSERDIKLGRGGIRELEFATQALQLQRAGADPWLRQGNTLLALHRLAERGLLGYAEYAALLEAYTFLRDLEHRLQLGEDRQTSVLPDQPDDLRILARRMQLDDADDGREIETLSHHLENHRNVVRTFYDTVLGRAAQLEIGEERPNPWIGPIDDAALLKELRTSGVDQAERILRPVKMMRRLLQPAVASIPLRRALRRSGPHLLHAAVRTRHPRRAFGNLEKLFSSLLVDPEDLLHFLTHREILVPTVHLLGRSDLLAGLLIRQPGILRTLEDRAGLLKTRAAEEYRTLLMEPAREPGDVQRRAGELRRRHQAALAMIALRDINRQATLREVLKSLSNLADATLDACAVLARDEMAEQGHPVPDDLRIAVVALGRLGYRELDYGSDLDLIFLQREANQRLVDGRSAATRLCESMVRILSTLTRDGQLYRVDLRLRPSGSQGDLVRSPEALLDYVTREAETWEMQSFLKARPVGGDRELGRRCVDAVEKRILKRAAGMPVRGLAEEIDGMRRRLVRTDRGDAERPNIKLGEGGLLDIHFIIEFLQLSKGIANPADKDTLRLLTHLHERGGLAEKSMRHLYEGYLFLRALDHEMRLIHDPPLQHLPADDERGAELARALDPAGIADEDSGRRLLDTFRRHAARILRAYRSCLGVRA